MLEGREAVVRFPQAAGSSELFRRVAHRRPGFGRGATTRETRNSIFYNIYITWRFMSRLTVQIILVAPRGCNDAIQIHVSAKIEWHLSNMT